MVGQGTNGLGQNPQRIDQNRNLAALGANDLPGGFDDIAQVHQVRFGITDRACFFVYRLHEVSAEKQLQLAGLILDMRKSQRALFAPGHQPAGDGDLLAIVLGEIVQNRFRVMRPLALGRVRAKA